MWESRSHLFSPHYTPAYSTKSSSFNFFLFLLRVRSICPLGGYDMSPVVCLRGGERGTCLGPPFWGPPLRCYVPKFSLFLMKNFLFTHTMYYKADYKYVLSFQRAPYRNCNVQVLCFQRGPNSNCNLKVICFQGGPQQPLKCASTLLLNFIEGAPKRNCNV